MLFGVSDGIGISEQQAALIGRIAIEWAAVEIKLQMILATVIAKDVALGLSATSNMGYKSIVATLRTLAGSATSTIPTFGPQIVILLDEAERLSIPRNAIVHAGWERIEPDGGLTAMVVRFKGKMQNRLEIWSTPLLTRVAEECGELLVALDGFMWAHEIHDEIDAYRHKQESHAKPVPLLPAEVQPRSPKAEALLRQLLASRP